MRTRVYSEILIEFNCIVQLTVYACTWYQVVAEILYFFRRMSVQALLLLACCSSSAALQLLPRLPSHVPARSNAVEGSTLLLASRPEAARSCQPTMLTRELLLTKIAPFVGAVLANCMFLSPAKAVLKARAEGSLGELNALPFAVMIGNTAAWLGYSFASKNPYVFAANFPGLLLGVFYSLTAIRLAPHKTGLLLEKVLLAYASVLGIAGYIAALAPSAQVVFGYVANALLLLYYSAPLSTLAQVIATRSAASLYWPLILMNGLNSTMWTIYGFAVTDAFVWAPNAAGLALSGIQLALVGVFGA